VIQAEVVWHNGQLIPFAEARTHVISFTLHYGLAVFEGIRCYRRADGRSALFRLSEHVDRLLESARLATIDVAYDAAELRAACAETVKANRLAEGYLRPLVYVGANALGIGARDNPTEVDIIAYPWPPMLGEEGLEGGIRAEVSNLGRGHLGSTLSKAKISGQYVASVLAKRQAQRHGCEDAIMLDSEGRVAEGTTNNIFIVYRGTLLTPPLEMSILAGITRDSVITLARDLGLEVVERTFTRDMLYTASEVFLTGTAVEVTPVREIDGYTIGPPGPVTRRLQTAFYTAARGPGEPHPEWLTWL
jgi:branched-chain amino acid aminotransferase